MTTKTISIEGTPLSEVSLRQFASEHDEAKLTTIRHMGAEPYTIKLLIIGSVIILKEALKLYATIKEIDSRCSLKINGIEIEGRKDDILEIYSSLKGNDDNN